MANFLLIQADPGSAVGIAEFISAVPGVFDVSITSGPYDVVAEVSPAPEHQYRIREAARNAPGLCRLCVCQGLAQVSGMS